MQEHFQVLEDPRVSGRIRPELLDVVVIAICGPKVKRLRAGWEHAYLERLVALALQPPSSV